MADTEGGISDYIDEPDRSVLNDFVEDAALSGHSESSVVVGGAEHSATGLVEFALGGLEIFGGAFEGGSPAKGSVSKFLQKHAGTPTLARLACGSICASVGKASVAGNAGIHGGGIETRALLLGRMATDKDFDEFDPEDLRDALELALDISLYLKRPKAAKVLRELIIELAQLTQPAQLAGRSVAESLARLEKIHAKFAAIADRLAP